MMYRYMYSVLIIYRYVCYVFMKWDINITCVYQKRKESANYHKMNHKQTNSINRTKSFPQI